MSRQFGTAVRDAWGNNFESTIGTAPKLILRTGVAPAACVTTDTGTFLAILTLPSDWLSASSAGVKSLLGTWTGTAGATGTIGHYRLKDSTATSTDNTGTTHEQGSVGMNVVIATSATTVGNSNVLTFVSTTGVATGQNVTGTGIVAGSTVIALTGTTVTLSLASTAGVASAASITFGYDMVVDNTSVANTQAVTISTYTLTLPGA